MGIVQRIRGRRRRGERGATLVEFAILAPLLFILVFAIIEFGRLGFAYAELWTSAREGARYSTTVGNTGGDPNLPNFVDCAGIREAARSKLTTRALSDSDILVAYVDPGTGSLLADCQAGGAPLPSESGNIDPGTEIRISVAGDFNSLLPLVGPFLESIPLDSTQSRSVHLGVLGG